jgi:hypothetical protein
MPDRTEGEMQERRILPTEWMDALEKGRDEARNRLEGKVLLKHWARSARESTLGDTVRTLRNPLGDQTGGRRGLDNEGLPRDAGSDRWEYLGASPDGEKLARH